MESKITPRLRAWGRDRGAVDSECGGVGEFTEGGFGANEEEFSFVAVKFQEVILHPESE